MGSFVAQQATRSRTLRIDGRPEDVFDLFGPIGEGKWSEDWDPTIVFPKTGISQGTVFVTTDKDGLETVWVITESDKSNCTIIYTSVTARLKVSLISISCEPDGANCTKARVTYTITALSEKGNHYVESFSEEYYREWMFAWERAINYYLKHGHALHHDHSTHAHVVGTSSLEADK